MLCVLVFYEYNFYFYKLLVVLRYYLKFCVTSVKFLSQYKVIFTIPDPDLPIHYTAFMVLRLRQMELSAKTVSPCAKDHIALCACAKSRQA